MTSQPGQVEPDVLSWARLSWRGKVIATVAVLLAGQIVAAVCGLIVWLNNLETCSMNRGRWSSLGPRRSA
jgi:hypothetical protein